MSKINEIEVKSYLDKKYSSKSNIFIKPYHKNNSKNKINLNCINTNNKGKEKNSNLHLESELKKPTKLLDFNNINTSSNRSNLNTEINSNTKRMPLENKKILNDNINKNNYNTLIPENTLKTIDKAKSLNKTKTLNLKQLLKKNSISYVDRQKIKKLNSATLKLYEIYMQRENQALQIEDSPENIDSIINEKNKYYNDNYISENLNSMKSNNIFIQKNNIKNLTINSSSNNSSGFSSIYKTKFKNNLKKLKTQRKYGLKQLVSFNPYHYVSKSVRYCNSVEMKNISEKLCNVNGATFNKKATSKLLFFKNENNNTKKRKVINSFAVSMNNNLSFKGGMVWRILAKITRITGYSSFYSACIFKGYHELWKHYSILIELLLVKYVEFKWFLEKNKYIKKDVFKEFLTCIKIEVKNDKSFSNKVFLLFDEENKGEINIKVFLFIMELISKSSEIEKINFYCELFSDIKLKDENKCISILEVIEIFKHIIDSPSYKKEYKYLYEIIKKEFNDGQKIENNILISKQQLYFFLINNKFIKKLMQHFKFQFRYADIAYNEEINSSFNSTVRNVKKFLNEQNETIQMSINECDNLENILKAILNKGKSKNKIDILQRDLYDDLNDE